MKKKLCISLVLAVILLFSLSMAVSASTTVIGNRAPIILADVVNVHSQSEAPAQTTNAAVEEIAEPEPPPAPVTRSSNTPYFVGAGIAILVFIGVAFYCKNNGHKTF